MFRDSSLVYGLYVLLCYSDTSRMMTHEQLKSRNSGFCVSKIREMCKDHKQVRNTFCYIVLKHRILKWELKISIFNLQAKLILIFGRSARNPSCQFLSELGAGTPGGGAGWLPPAGDEFMKGYRLLVVLTPPVSYTHLTLPTIYSV